MEFWNIGYRLSGGNDGKRKKSYKSPTNSKFFVSKCYMRIWYTQAENFGYFIAERF